jgi:hypothetical protein
MRQLLLFFVSLLKPVGAGKWQFQIDSYYLNKQQ